MASSSEQRRLVRADSTREKGRGEVAAALLWMPGLDSQPAASSSLGFGADAEFISHPTYGVDQAFAKSIIHFPPQIVDIDVYHIGASIKCQIPRVR